MVALLPWDLADLAQAVLVLVLADRSHLRSAGLATHGETGIGDALGVARAALLVDDRVHAVENEGKYVWIDAERGKVGRRAVAARRQDALGSHEARDDRPSGDEPRDHDCELQRRRQHCALPDSGDQGLALGPSGAGGCQLPLPAGDQAGALAGDVQTEGATEAEPPCHPREPLNAQPPRGLVEEDVTGSFDRVPQTDSAVPALAPAVERGVAERDIPRTGYRCLGGQHSGCQGCRSNHRLERRPRWIDPRDHLIGQRVAGICREQLPQRGSKPGGELRRIEARDRDESEYIAAYRVEQNARHAFLGTTTAGRKILHHRIEADHHILPGPTGNPPELAHDAAKGVDLDLAGPGTSPQLAILGLLDAVLTDANIRQL